MAVLWRAFAPVTFATVDAPRSMIDVANDGTSTSIVKVYRIWQFDTIDSTSISGAITGFTVARTLVSTMAPNIAPVAYRTADLPRAVTCGTRREPVHSSVFRQYRRDANEWSTPANTINNWEFDVPMSEVWNAGYNDANVQPITARAGQGVHLRQETASGSPFLTIDFEMEFTVE